MLDTSDKLLLAYVIGVAIGDGNLSNPNKRAVRLRVTCDKKYPCLNRKIYQAISKVAPNNKVSIVNRKDNCIDISCYSNDWEKVLGWQANQGSKLIQSVSVPMWIKKQKKYMQKCLTGLFETDGSIYIDRSYLTINFVTSIKALAIDVEDMIKKLGYRPNMQIGKNKHTSEKYTIRISKDPHSFLESLSIVKQ